MFLPASVRKILGSAGVAELRKSFEIVMTLESHEGWVEECRQMQDQGRAVHIVRERYGATDVGKR